MPLQIFNGATTGLAVLQHSAAEIERENAELTEKLRCTLQRFDTIQNDANQIEQDVIDNVSPIQVADYSQSTH